MQIISKIACNCRTKQVAFVTSSHQYNDAFYYYSDIKSDHLFRQHRIFTTQVRGKPCNTLLASAILKQSLIKNFSTRWVFEPGAELKDKFYSKHCTNVLRHRFTVNLWHFPAPFPDPHYKKDLVPNPAWWEAWINLGIRARRRRN